MTESERLDQAPVPGAGSRSAWRRWAFPSLLSKPEEVPRIWGLALVGCFLGGLFTLGAVSIKFHQNSLREVLSQTQERALHNHASRAAPLFRSEQSNLVAEMVRLKADHDFKYCMLVLPDGKILAHSDPAKVGTSWVDGMPPTSDDAQRVLRDDEWGHPLTELAVKVTDSSGAELGALVAGYATTIPLWDTKGIGAWLGLVILGSLTMLLVLYRLLRRMLRPMSKIRDRLMVCSRDMGSRLRDLRIEDEAAAVTSAWNRLLETADELQTASRSMESKRELAHALMKHDTSQSKEVLEWHPDGVLLIDEFGQVGLLNKACRALARVDDPDPIGKSVSGLSRDEDLNQVITRLSSSPKNHRTTIYHTMVEEGLTTTLSVTVVNMGSEKGPNGTLLVFRDASQQKQAEKARDDFLHQVTHEFRTPLANIRAYTETLMEGILEDKDAQRECLNVINSESNRLGRLVEEVLTASQLEVGTARLRLASVEISRLLQQAVQDLQAIADEKNVELHMKLPPKVPKIQGDKDRLAVVLNNLLSNAIKYCDAGGSVTLVCEDRGRNLEISVIDTGMGIPEDELPNIFDKFFRSSSEKVQSLPGTGLGLATARQIVRLHGGEITVQSEVGKGSHFTMTLPVYEVDAVSAG